MSAPAQLAAGLAEVLGSEVVDLVRLSGGASRETWTCRSRSGRRLVVQRQRPGALESGPGMPGEAVLLAAAGAAGVPVPRVVASGGAGSPLGAPFLVTGWLEGEALGHRVVRAPRDEEARRSLTTEVGAALAAVHSIDVGALGPVGEPVDPLDSLDELLLALDRPRPALEAGLRWLRAHRPPPTGRTVVHGDFRTGNLLIDDRGLVAVLDWELAHVGDPAEDLGWYCVRSWRFGSAERAGGLGSAEALLEAYRAAGGRPIDLDVLLWWEVLGNLRWAVITMVQVAAHLGGVSRSVDLAAIGRRTAEAEWDLLQLLQGVGR